MLVAANLVEARENLRGCLPCIAFNRRIVPKPPTLFRPCSMKTDKQLFKVFEAVPEWVFELAGLPSPGSSTLRSFTAKALERAADGLVVPDAPDQPLTVVEFQFRRDENVYTRTVAEMVAVQEANPGAAFRA